MFAVEDVYIAELMVENCLLIGDETNCSCSTGFVWSNLVCANFNCCRETACEQNVSNITPLCIAKVPVFINGSILLNGITWDATQTTTLQTTFEELNAFEYLNVTGQRLLDAIVDFEAVVNAIFPTAVLQALIDNLEAALGVVFQINTEGMVGIEAPEIPVCYMSTPVLKCLFEEATDVAGWNLSTQAGHFELATGSVVKLDYDCATEDFMSCVIVTLQNLTGIWSGE
ncbi:hypothetical protein EYF80_004652 [Liparis tanakae]|uniref:Uncharacterized protein n=1 Tax=Liparis tanakae TaxID=230148 RepID=A0A4Z2J5R0_9TELE|nr:hypothetical protein EYF80_004652 [Liparis tanakae]